MPLVKKYFRAGKSVHQDYIDKLEVQMEVHIYRLLNLHLRLIPAWPHRKRWLDFPGEFSWERRPSFLKGSAELSWGYLNNIAGTLYSEPLKVYLGTYKHKKLVYMLKWGKKDGQYFSNGGKGISYKRRGCR